MANIYQFLNQVVNSYRFKYNNKMTDFDVKSNKG